MDIHQQQTDEAEAKKGLQPHEEEGRVEDVEIASV